MNPLLKDRRALGLYLAVCMVLGAVLAALLVLAGRAAWTGALAFCLPLMVVFGFMSLSAWYVCRTFPLQGTNLGALLTVLLGSSLLSSALWSLLGLAWSALLERIIPGALPGERTWEEGLVSGGVGVALFLLATLVHYLVAVFAAARAAERKALELQLLARDAELKALRAQIDPHFLFNSLNSISALTSADPAAARSMSLKLAEFLRLSLEYGALRMITLEQEFSLVSRFLEIEKVRFGARLQLRCSIDDPARSCPVPPLLLQPLVENAVHHGIAHLLEGGTIGISATREGGQVRISVENPFDPETQRPRHTGLGLDNVRQRVWKTFGSRGQVDVRRENGCYVAVLTLPAA